MTGTGHETPEPLLSTRQLCAVNMAPLRPRTIALSVGADVELCGEADRQVVRQAGGQQVREMGREVPMGRFVGLLALVDQVHRLDRLPRLVLGLGPVVFFRSRLGRKNSKRTAISRNGT